MIKALADVETKLNVNKASLKNNAVDKPIKDELGKLVAQCKVLTKCIRYKISHESGWELSELKDDIVSGSAIIKEANKQVGLAKSHKKAASGSCK